MSAKQKNKKNQQQPQPQGFMDTLLEALSTKQKTLRVGMETEATLTSVQRNNLLFDLGGKALAVLGDRETKEVAMYAPFLKIGEKITVRVITPESRDGYPVVSLSKFFDHGKWKILADKREKEEIVEVVCGDYGKGGLFVDCMGIRGVIPKIQLAGEAMEKPEKMHGQKIKVKVLEVDEIKNRLVVSLKAVVNNISQKQVKESFEKIQIGDVLDARVLGTSDFGVFCEIGGVEGLVHISEISWEKVDDASGYVKPGQEMKVKVVDKNINDLKLNLSIKRLTGDPWIEIEDRYPKDRSFEGEIVRQERYGYFVKLEPGVEGLIHISKLRGDENFQKGQKIQVFVERVSLKDRRMSLVLPQKDTAVLYR